LETSTQTRDFSEPTSIYHSASATTGKVAEIIVSGIRKGLVRSQPALSIPEAKKPPISKGFWGFFIFADKLLTETIME
jgi:hypothetical protein